ncbi:MAG: hypothetical protein HYW78_01540 [Parcubacteria group bacterium]|nr:hypothetical protein [Parcubacteria group bacterium]
MPKYRLTYEEKQPGGWTFTKKFPFEVVNDDEAKKEVKRFEDTRCGKSEVTIEKLERIVVEYVAEQTTEIKL